MEEKIRLGKLLKVVRKRYWIVLVFVFMSALLGLIYVKYFTNPVYVSSAKLQIEGISNSTEITEKNSMMEFFINYIPESDILTIVSEELNGEFSEVQLKNIISMWTSASVFMNVSVTYKDPNEAILIVNKFIEVIEKVKPDYLAGLEIAELATPEKVETISGSVVKTVGLSIIVGIFLGFGLVFLLEFLNSTINDEQDIAKYLNAPLLGVVASYDRKKLTKRMVVKNVRKVKEKEVNKWEDQKMKEEKVERTYHG
ncbi:Wzz/FepE/Etk N-terminal domain-containing protein [Caldibacillus lycopersici]|uniref:Wzz/FepE/Etk N-terminal domain-containing protein n=1 Tax=Perspicuibacillus lycopersici TaxID=1325689 RepID=A0AAE3IRZ9_9BACI|nr:Wzz/FepE/Etk N-terminal domain-containing protein [Perspicuibacillus lycopersici]MCU9612336.1 Wzz/FepE/Etk N-terminal domain-containing protein [Perspicuibacillus lycopersici]